MYETSKGISDTPEDVQYAISVIDQETEQTILERYSLHDQLNINRIASVEIQKKLLGLPNDEAAVVLAMEANAFIETTRENGRIKKSALTN